jgi:hypothetical protein
MGLPPGADQLPFAPEEIAAAYSAPAQGSPARPREPGASGHRGPPHRGGRAPGGPLTNVLLWPPLWR